jgi:hypothetical protein
MEFRESARAVKFRSRRFGLLLDGSGLMIAAVFDVARNVPRFFRSFPSAH